MQDRAGEILNPQRRFSSWAVLLGLLVALLYLPTLSIPFDFAEDGYLVYSELYSPEAGNFFSAVLHRSSREYRVTGPFRPVTWGHFMVSVLLHDQQAWGYRLERMLLCGASACIFLLLLREFRVSLVPALAITWMAFGSPYRNEIWMHHGMPEAFGNVYALLALWAALRAERSARPWCWDLLAIFALLFALGIKNTYLAIVPALLWGRFLRSQGPLLPPLCSIRASLWGYLAIGSLPILHFLSLKLWPSETHFATAFSIMNVWNRLSCYAEGLHLVVLLPSLILATWLAFLHWSRDLITTKTLGFALLLVSAGMVVYAPWSQMHARYILPGVWGLDLLLALLLTIAWRTPSWRRVLLIVLLVVALGKMSCDNVREQTHLARVLQPMWQALEDLETQSDPRPFGLYVCNIEASQGKAFWGTEAVHFTWHVRFRRRAVVPVVTVSPGDATMPPRLLTPVKHAPDPAYRLVASYGDGSPEGRSVHLWERDN